MVMYIIWHREIVYCCGCYMFLVEQNVLNMISSDRHKVCEWLQQQTAHEVLQNSTVLIQEAGSWVSCIGRTNRWHSIKAQYTTLLTRPIPFQTFQTWTFLATDHPRKTSASLISQNFDFFPFKTSLTLHRLPSLLMMIMKCQKMI